MKGPIQYQRHFVLQVHCIINAFCFLVTFFCVLILRFRIGLLELLALLLPIIGILALFMNENLGKGRKVVKECYLFGSLASIFSLFFVSQVLVQFCYTGWLWGTFYFLFTGAVVAGIIYFLFFTHVQLINKCMSPISLAVALVVWILISIVIYRFFLCYFFKAGFILLFSYLLWVLDIILAVFICLDLRIILFKGR